MGVEHIVDCYCRSTETYRFSLATAACLAVAFFAATAWGQMYSDALLRAKQARIEDNLAYTVEHDIPDHTAPAYQAAARGVTLDFQDLRGLDFLDFQRRGKVVSVPVDALQFLDDLATVQAWLERRNCDGGLLQNYVFHLVTPGRKGGLSVSPEGKTLSPEGKTLSPTDAFGLDRAAALNDRFVNDVSEKLYNTAVWFLLAHEIGHVALGHTGQYLKQENAADDFALDAMRRKHLLPAGIVLYLTAVSLADQANAARTHDVSAARVRRIADALRWQPQDFVANESKDREGDRAKVLKISDEISRMADALSQILAAEGTLSKAGERIQDVRKVYVFKPVDYKTTCAAPH